MDARVKPAHDESRTNGVGMRRTLRNKRALSVVRLAPSVLELHPEAAGEILHILPGDAPRARAAGGRPFERLRMRLLAWMRDAVMGDVAVDHFQEFILAAAVEAEP